MNELIKALAEEAGIVRTMPANVIPGIMKNRFTHLDPEKFAELIVKEFYDICNQAWALHEREKAKEGVTHAELLVFAGASAMCQKMKENINLNLELKNEH